MKIIVCVKVVPVSDSVITLSADHQSIDLNNIKFDLNPYDEYAIEAAVQIKEKNNGEVIAVSYGPERDGIVLKRVLALGTDRLIHLIGSYDPFGDPVATADALAGVLRPINPDLVFCGKVAIDTGNGLVGPLLARRLGMPCISGVCELKVENDLITAARETEAGRATLKCATPCLLSTEKGLNKPRYPSLKDIMLARKKEYTAIRTEPGQNFSRVVEFSYPEPRPNGKILGNDKTAVPELLRRLRDEARVI
jgi:electron transfer flavoprotein beta subunit